MSAERVLENQVNGAAHDIRATVSDVLTSIHHGTTATDHHPRTRPQTTTLKQGCDVTWNVHTRNRLVITREMFGELEVAEIPHAGSTNGDARGFSYTVFRPVLEDGIPTDKGIIDMSRTQRDVDAQAIGPIKQMVSSLRRVPRR